MFENFTGSARRALSLAKEEALHLGHDYTGTQHLLLGLLRGEGSVAGKTLKALGVDEGKSRSIAGALGVAGSKGAKLPEELPLTPRAKRVIDFSVAHATAQTQSHVSPEHLLLGLLEENEGIAAEVLKSLGVSAEAARKELGKILNRDVKALSEDVRTAIEAPAAPTSNEKPKVGAASCGFPVPAMPMAAPKGSPTLLCPNCAAHVTVPDGLAVMRCDTCGASLALVTEGGVSGLRLLPPEKPVPYSNAKVPAAAITPGDIVTKSWARVLYERDRKRKFLLRVCKAFAALGAISAATCVIAFLAAFQAPPVATKPALMVALVSMAAVPIFGYLAGHSWDKAALLAVEIDDVFRHLSHVRF